MSKKTLSSDKARTNWRYVVDTAVAGEPVVIERYGKPAVAVIAYQDFVRMQTQLREKATAYQIERQPAKEAPGWQEEVSQLRMAIESAGGLSVGQSREAVIERLRQTRREIFEAEYGHLYR